MKLNLDRKLKLLYGKGKWRTYAPSFFTFVDGPNGVRKENLLRYTYKATCFPSLSTVSNSWNILLLEELGKSLASEAKYYKANVLLGPNLNLKRTPYAGRNFECFSEDAYLSGKLGAAYIKGVQENNILACPKHFFAYQQETKRQGIDNHLKEKVIREIYLEPFEIVMKEKPQVIMTCYNKVNGKYISENAYYLQEVLRNQLGFDGIIISDWNSAHNIVTSIKSGINIEMPGSNVYLKYLKKGYRNGKITLSDINCRIEEMLNVERKMKQQGKGKVDWHKNHALARKLLEESIVLLKNNDSLLPIAVNKKVVAIGELAVKAHFQGYGSAKVRCRKYKSFLSLKKIMPFQFGGYQPGYNSKNNDKIDVKLESKALKLVKDADIVLFFCGTTIGMETEGADRTTLNLPYNQVHLLEKIKKMNKKIIGILEAGSAVVLPFSFDAILYCGLGGEALFEALLNVLTGKVNPSGKLSESFACKESDYPILINDSYKGNIVCFDEEKQFGYRYFDSNQAKIMYPFGYGLSYTQFNLNNLILKKEGVYFNIKNIGNYDGSEVCQLYVKFEKDSYRELKGFTKVFLQKKEEKNIFIPFDDFTFRSWNEKTNSWEIREGNYTLFLGTNVMDERLKIDIYMKQQILKTFKIKENVNDYQNKDNFLDKTIFELQKNSNLARKICKIGKNSLAKNKPNLFMLYLSGMTLQSIIKNSKGFLENKVLRHIFLDIFK